MIITGEEQFKLIDEYQNKGKTIDEELGFVDGMQAILELVDKKLTEEKQK